MTKSEQNVNSNSSGAVDLSKPAILLSVQNSKNRELVRKILPDYFTVKISENGLSHHFFDLYILDHQSFKKDKQVLRNLKNKTEPIFLPFLLLSQNEQTMRNNTKILEMADDVLDISAPTKLLQSRIKMLLQQREYSLKLREKNQELERKNKKLMKEKRKYHLLTENSTDMISRHNPDGTYLYASPASKELTGYKPEELLGQNMFDNMHPDDREVIIDENVPFFYKSMIRWTFRKETKSGDYKWVESTMNPIRDNQKDKIIEIQASTRDISDRKKYERQLKGEKEFIDTTIESLPGIFFMLDEDLNFIKWNDNLNNILGYSDSEINQMQPTDFFEASKHDRIRTKINEILTTGVSDIEISIKSKDGELIPHYLIGRKLERKNADYIVGTGIDITERLGMEQKLRESEKRWANLVKNDPDLIQILDSNGVIKFINQAGAKMLGFESTAGVVGKNYFDFIELEEKKAELMKERVQHVLDGYEIERHTFKVKDFNGKLLYLESKAVPITLSDGRKGLQQVAQDVTDRVEYERRLETSLKEKKTLLQEIHHRVKNNLAVVSGMMELQTLKTDNQEVKRLLDDSKNRIKTMALIHEKLYQSKSLSQIDFGACITNLVENIQEAPNNNINFKLDYDSINLNVNQAVPCALIINEVVSNALEEENDTIKISLEEQAHTIIVNISDNGHGLPNYFDECKKKSIGITIIETLISQLQADQKMESKDGFSYTFSFEKQEIKGSSSSLI